MESKLYLMRIYIKLHNQGMPFDQIAEHLGMTAQGLQRMLNEANSTPNTTDSK